ncbi:MAG: helix-hairpin-helix domain-containing protein [Rhodothermus sp.]|nr:helix-hairpin-helix domain-containing protein [Rhodothermus sp.]
MRLLAILLSFSVPAAAQPTRQDTLLTPSSLEAALEGLTIDPEALEELAAWLDERRQDPLDLNAASAEELARLPGLSLLLARRIVQYRQQHGPFASTGELLQVPGFSGALLHRLRPFVSVRSSRPPVRLAGYVLQRLDYRLASSTGDPGPPVRLQTRLRLRYGRLKTALTLENDPGEPLRWDPKTRTYGFDHQAGFVAWHGTGWLRQLILGDFSARFGAGLTLWSLPAIDSYQAPADAPLRSGTGLTPYSGTDETRYFRGLALTVAPVPALMVALFASRRRLDARLDTLPTTRQAGVVSLPASGLHRTEAERSRKGILRTDVLGGALTLKYSRGTLGLVGYVVRFSHPLQPTKALYNRHAWRGRMARTLGLFGRFLIGQTLLQAELGSTLGRPPGLVTALSGPLGRFARGTLAFRHLPARFVSLYGDPFDTRSGSPAGETGTYAGLELMLAPGWQLQAAVDQHRLNWPRYGRFWPTTGRALWIRLTAHPRPWLETYLQFRYDRAEQRTEASGPAAATFETTAPEHYFAIRWQGLYAFSATVHLEARLEYVRRLRNGLPTIGWLLYQGIHWRPHPGLQLDARLTFFDSDMGLVLYVPEPGLRYSMGLAALSNQGQRTLLRLQLQPLARLLLQIRYTTTLRAAAVRSLRRTWQFLALWHI